MEEMQKSVNEFRTAMDLEIGERPRALSKESAERHVKMIRDEFEKELVPAILSGDILETYDAIIDVIYFLIGAASDSGMDIEPGFKEVHRSNMSKMDPRTRKAIKAKANDPSGEPEGKVLKGPDYFVPNLMRILVNQSILGTGPSEIREGHTPDATVPLTINGVKVGDAYLLPNGRGGFSFDVYPDDLSVLGLVEDQVGLSIYAKGSLNDAMRQFVDGVEIKDVSIAEAAEQISDMIDDTLAERTDD